MFPRPMLYFSSVGGTPIGTGRGSAGVSARRPRRRHRLRHRALAQDPEDQDLGARPGAGRRPALDPAVRPAVGGPLQLAGGAAGAVATFITAVGRIVAAAGRCRGAGAALHGCKRGGVLITTGGAAVRPHRGRPLVRADGGARRRAGGLPQRRGRVQHPGSCVIHAPPVYVFRDSRSKRYRGGW